MIYYTNWGPTKSSSIIVIVLTFWWSSAFRWLSVAFGRWLLMVERLLSQRRAQMVRHGRILLNKSQCGLFDRELSRADVETQLKSEKDL